MENPNDPTKPQRPPSSADRVAAAERDRDEAIRELETIRSMRIVRLGLAVSETVSERDLRGLPTRVSTALRREDVAPQPTASDDATGTGDDSGSGGGAGDEDTQGCSCTARRHTPALLALAPLVLVVGLRRRRISP